MATEYVVVTNKTTNLTILNESGPTFITSNQTPRSLSVISSTQTIPSGLYASVDHTHLSSDITDFQSSVQNLISSYQQIYQNSVSSGLFGNGRLALNNSNPISHTDTTSSVLYFIPYFGNQISLYNTNQQMWDTYTFDTLSLSLSGMISDYNYDIFIYLNNNVLTLEKIQWTNNSTRSNTLVLTNGIPLQSGSLNKRYIGSIRSISSNQTEDSSSRRFVFNINNQILKPLYCYDTTNHTYTSNTARPYRNITTIGNTRFELINGSIDNSIMNIICDSNFTTETNSSSVGLALNSTTSFNTDCINTTSISGPNASILTNNNNNFISISPGYHYLQLIQSGSSVSTFYTASMKALLLC